MLLTVSAAMAIAAVSKIPGTTGGTVTLPKTDGEECSRTEMLDFMFFLLISEFLERHSPSS
jgi:hypothetical protein